jgi:hypothetical protein
MRRPVLVAALFAAAALLVLAVPVRTVADSVQSVLITNWPKYWDVKGAVSIDGPVKLAKGVAIRDLVVPPVNPKETVRLIQGATIETDGFTNMVLSLEGQIKGEVYRQGTVGVFLLPDEEPIVRIFDEKGVMQFAQEINAPGVSGASPYFASSQPKLPIAFSRYRTYFYNSSDKTVTVNLFAYLTN